MKKSIKTEAYQFLTDSDFNEDIKKIKVFKALDDETINGNDLFEKSGLKILTEKLLNDLKTFNHSIKGGFMEVSTIASALHNNRLDAFNVNFVDINMHGSIKEKFDNNVNVYFANIIDLLRKENLILFNHPDFLIHPSNILNFISILDDSCNLITDKPYPYKEAIDRHYRHINPKIETKTHLTPGNGKIRGTDYTLKIRKSSIKDITYSEITSKVPRVIKKTLNELLNITKCGPQEIFGLHYLNHKFYHEHFQKGFNQNPSMFISIPILDPHPKNENKYLGIGVLFIFLLLDKETNYADLQKTITEAYCNDVPKIIRSYLPGYITRIADEKLAEVKKYAIKAAETKILSRNFSHHIGSHVMPNVSLKQIRKRYTELCGNAIEDDFLDIVKSRLDTYITERNEFLCDPAGTLKSVLFYSQTIIPFIENVLIQDNLCRSEGLGYRAGKGCDIQIHVKIDGQPITSKFGAYSYPDHLPYDGIYDHSGKKTHINAKVTGNDVPIALPNTHVIFSILENFIRNTAKHQKRKFKDDPKNKKNAPRLNLIVFIDLKTIDDHSFQLTISDNVSVVPGNFPDKQKANIISGDNVAIRQDLGIIDFKICAGLLNNKRFEKVDEEKLFEIKLNKKNELSYRFKVLRPKDICLIGYDKPSAGQDIKTFDFYANAETFLKAKRTTIPYQFYVIKERALQLIIEKEEHINLLPFRLLVERETKDSVQGSYWREEVFGRRYLLITGIDLHDTKENILEYCWTEWINRWGINENNKTELIVYSEEKLEGWDDKSIPIANIKYGYGVDGNERRKDIKKERTNLYPKIFYSHHGGGLSGKTFSQENSFISSNAFIPFGKNSRDLPLIRNSNPERNNLLPYWLIEAGLTKILIIDERIADIASNIYEHGTTIHPISAHGQFGCTADENETYSIRNIDAFWGGNVIVATHLNNNRLKEGDYPDHPHFVKLDISATGVKTHTNFEYASSDKYPEKDMTTKDILAMKYDAVIIHRTFLNDESKELYWSNIGNEDVLTVLDRHFPLVFVTSGGGQMHTTGDKSKFKFISFNEILNCLIVPENIGKQALTNNLFSR